MKIETYMTGRDPVKRGCVFDRAEDDLEWWYLKRDALLGIRSSGFEGSAASVWDDARSSRAHGLAIDEHSGVYERLYTGRTSISHQVAMARAARIETVMQVTPPETCRVLSMSFATCSAPPRVATYFNTDARAPLVGLGVKLWYELQPLETRPRYELLRVWDSAILSNTATRALLRPVKSRAVDVYHAALGIYDEVRRHVARTRSR